MLQLSTDKKILAAAVLAVALIVVGIITAGRVQKELLPAHCLSDLLGFGKG